MKSIIKVPIGGSVHKIAEKKNKDGIMVNEMINQHRIVFTKGTNTMKCSSEA